LIVAVLLVSAAAAVFPGTEEVLEIADIEDIASEATTMKVGDAEYIPGQISLAELREHTLNGIRAQDRMSDEVRRRPSLPRHLQPHTGRLPIRTWRRHRACSWT
jgi:hypothetical protein